MPHPVLLLPVIAFLKQSLAYEIKNTIKEKSGFVKRKYR